MPAQRTADICASMRQPKIRGKRMGDSMNGKKVLGAGMLLALLLAVLPASAMAGAGLELSSGGTPVANGTPGATGLSIGECSMFSEGVLNGNNTSKVKITGEKAVASECAEGKSISGAITETQLGKTGKATLKGNVSLTTAGPCVYTFKSLKGEFEVPGTVFYAGEAVGKLSKKVSAPTCEKTISLFYAADATNTAFGEPFEDQLS